MTQSAFLKDFREESAKVTRGCIVLEKPDLIKQLVVKHGAKDTTARQDRHARDRSDDAAQQPAATPAARSPRNTGPTASPRSTGSSASGRTHNPVGRAVPDDQQDRRAQPDLPPGPPMLLPLLTLPRAVPMVKDRPPQDSVPPTKEQRELVRTLAQRYVARREGGHPAVARRTAKARHQARRDGRAGREVHELRRRGAERRGQPRSTRVRALRPPAAAAAQVPAGWKTAAPPRSTSSASCANSAAFAPFRICRTKPKARLRGVDGRRVGARHGDHLDREDRRYPRRQLPVGAGTRLPVYGNRPPSPAWPSRC